MGPGAIAPPPAHTKNEVKKMNTIFADLCTFFGIESTPSNFAELIPWLFQVLLAVGLFLFVFCMIRSFVLQLTRGRW